MNYSHCAFSSSQVAEAINGRHHHQRICWKMCGHQQKRVKSIKNNKQWIIKYSSFIPSIVSFQSKCLVFCVEATFEQLTHINKCARCCLKSFNHQLFSIIHISFFVFRIHIDENISMWSVTRRDTHSRLYTAGSNSVVSAICVIFSFSLCVSLRAISCI